jgi:hypothetical protein
VSFYPLSALKLVYTITIYRSAAAKHALRAPTPVSNNLIDASRVESRRLTFRGVTFSIDLQAPKTRNMKRWTMTAVASLSAPLSRKRENAFYVVTIFQARGQGNEFAAAASRRRLGAAAC